MKRFLETVNKFSGEKIGQKPGVQWRGNDPKPPGKKLVGEKSVFSELNNHIDDNAIERKLKESFAQFSEGWKGELVAGGLGSLAGSAIGKVAGAATGAISGAKLSAIAGGVPGAVAGGALGSAVGGTVGGMTGQKIGDKLGGEDKAVTELSTNKLDQYSKAADTDYDKSYKAGDFKKSFKRAQGLMKAAGKKINNDVKKLSNIRNVSENANPVDTITMDVPFLIRVMEFAREDALSDKDLHVAAERLISASIKHPILSMNVYDSIFDFDNQEQSVTEYGNAQNPDNQTTTPGATGSAQQDTENDMGSMIGAQATNTSINALKSISPTINTNLAKQALAKSDVPTTMSSAETAQAKELSDLLGTALSNPQTSSQVTTLIRKAAQLQGK